MPLAGSDEIAQAIVGTAIILITCKLRPTGLDGPSKLQTFYNGTKKTRNPTLRQVKMQAGNQETCTAAGARGQQRTCLWSRSVKTAKHGKCLPVCLRQAGLVALARRRQTNLQGHRASVHCAQCTVHLALPGNSLERGIGQSLALSPPRLMSAPKTEQTHKQSKAKLRAEKEACARDVKQNAWEKPLANGTQLNWF